MLGQSFGLFFFLKKPKNQKSDERYVYLRITVDGIPKEVSLKREWHESRWDQTQGRAKGHKEDALKLNAFLDVFVASVYSAKSKFMSEERTITSEALKNLLSGNHVEKRKLLAVFQKHNEEILSLVGNDYAYRTYQRYRTTYDHTKAFLKSIYNIEDLELKELNYGFAKDFSIWLKTVKKCNHNSAMKYISTLKTVLLECIKKKWLREDPFAEFKTAQKEVHIVPLYIDELNAIKEKVFDIERLELVKDIFIFCCYTGLAYVDVGNLKRSQIVTGIDGEKWIITTRQKTETPQRVPLLPQAIEIIKKYTGHFKCMKDNLVLPVLSNQKMNAYLKEIADVCGIKKKLTFHLARHTFATTVTLSNGVPLETVSKMLGHKSIKQTQHYAKIVDLKISTDMAALKQRIGTT
jgi:integrase